MSNGFFDFIIMFCLTKFSWGRICRSLMKVLGRINCFDLRYLWLYCLIVLILFRRGSTFFFWIRKITCKICIVIFTPVLSFSCSWTSFRKRPILKGRSFFPFILFTFVRGYTGQVEKHKKADVKAKPAEKARINFSPSGLSNLTAHLA